MSWRGIFVEQMLDDKVRRPKCLYDDGRLRFLADDFSV